MTPPPTFTPAPRRVHRKRKQGASPTPAPAALTLLEAAFDENAPSIRLTFDRAIDVAGLVGAQIVVDDGAMTGARYEAVGAATLDGPAAVVIGLLELEPSEDPGTLLTAGAGNGIVAVDDGGVWSGVSGLVLPFP